MPCGLYSIRKGCTLRLLGIHLFVNDRMQVPARKSFEEHRQKSKQQKTMVRTGTCLIFGECSSENFHAGTCISMYDEFKKTRSLSQTGTHQCLSSLRPILLFQSQKVVLQ